MGYFFVDDSVHKEAGFIIGACVYSKGEISSKIAELFISHGFSLSEFEFKSSINYSKNQNQRQLREDMKKLVNDYCQLGIVIIPEKNRDYLGYECIKAIKQFILNNECIKNPLCIYFDQGMFNTIDTAKRLIASLNFTDCSFNLEQNSKTIRGIQLADLCAHICSIQLKGTMGLVNKKILINNIITELDFEMWATVRHVFFKGASKKALDLDNFNFEDVLESATLLNTGLYISEYCNEVLKENALQTFEEIYVGCIQ